MNEEIDFKLLFDAVPTPILVLDTSFTVVAANKAYLEALMIEHDNLVGHNMFEAIPENPEDPTATGTNKVRESLQRVIEQKAVDTLAVQKYDIPRPDGSYEVRYWSPIHTPVFDKRGNVKYIIHKVDDITDFVILKEQEKHHAKDSDQMRSEILARSTELQKVNDELRAASNSKNQFLSRMSHELRTPLAAIIGFSQLLQMTDLEEDKKQWVEIIANAGEHLHFLVNEILDLARIESGRLTISMETVPLNSVLEEVCKLMEPMSKSYNICLNLTPPAAQHLYVMADHQRLKQVIINLVSNAIKYNSAEGSVQVCVKDAPPDRVRIGVTDTGAGLSEKAQEKIFIPFERLGAEDRGIEGTGIGLAIVKHLVEAMNGSMGIESKEGVGSTFWIELELSEPLAISKTKGHEDMELDKKPYSSQKKLLYIEDTLANIKLIEGVFRQRPSIELISAMQGQKGVEMAKDEMPDMILLDLHLPDIGGGEVLKRIKEDEKTRDIPVVILSADATRSQMPSLLEMGAKDYLTKPINIHDLLVTVDKILEPKPAA